MGVDSVVWGVLWFVSGFAVGAVTGDIQTTGAGADVDLEGTPALVSTAIWLGLAIGYHAVTEWRYGTTLGKRLVAIEVTDADGGPITLRASLVRNLLRLVDWLPLFYVVGLVSVALSERDRRLGDRLADTVVVPD